MGTASPNDAFREPEGPHGPANADGARMPSKSAGEGANPGCPGWAMLEASIRDPQAHPEVVRHIEACAACSAIAQDIRSNTRIGTMLRALAPTISPQPGAPLAGLGAQSGVPADLVPGYVLTRELHRGGQGVVYRATQPLAKREVAIKMLLSGSFATAKQRQRFELEAEIASQLRHPNIASVHEVVQLPGDRYAIIMELVEGARIDEQAFAGASPQQRLRSLLTTFLGVCDAVAHAHRAGVIHRDLKPSNIMIDREGQPRLLDFGIARRSSQDANVTVTGEAAWTLAYASPEQLDDPRLVDVRSDVYSMGVVLYELLANAPPYDTKDVPLSAALLAVKLQVPKPLRLRDEYGGVPPAPDLRAVVAHALEKRAEARYQSVEAFASDLRSLVLGHAVRAPSLTAWYHLRKAARQHWRLLALGGATFSALVTGLAIWATQREQTLLAREQAASAREQAQQESADAQGVRLLMYQLAGPGQVSLSINGNSVDDPPTPQRQMLDNLGLRLDMGELADAPRTDASLRSLLAEIYAAHDELSLSEHHHREAIRSLRQGLASGDISQVAFDRTLQQEHVKLARVLARSNRREQARALCDAITANPNASPKARVAAHVLLGELALDAPSGLEDLPLAIKHAQLAWVAWSESNPNYALNDAQGRPNQDSTPDFAILSLESQVALRTDDRWRARRLADAAMVSCLRTNFDEHPDTLLVLKQLASVPTFRWEMRGLVTVRDELARGAKLGQDIAARAYWELGRAQLIDPRTNRVMEMFDPGVVRSRVTTAALQARDAMNMKAIAQCVGVYKHLRINPASTHQQFATVAMLACKWSLRDGDLETAQRWAQEASRRLRARSTQDDPDVRLHGALLTQADIACYLGQYDQALPLLEEAARVELEQTGRLGRTGVIVGLRRNLIAMLREKKEINLDSVPWNALSEAEWTPADRSERNLLLAMQTAFRWGAFANVDLAPAQQAVREGRHWLATSQLHRDVASTMRATLSRDPDKPKYAAQEAIARQLDSLLRGTDRGWYYERDWTMDRLPP